MKRVLTIGGVFLALNGLLPLPDAQGESKEQLPLFLQRTGQITCYDGGGGVVPFQGSGQDGEFQRGRSWPDPRFINNNDGTVTDNLTGLMWLKDGNCFGAHDWATALKVIRTLNTDPASQECHDYRAKYTDWSLPNLNEMLTLFNAEEKVPADYLKLEGITELQATDYWSSTSYMNPLNSWQVSFADGSVTFAGKLEERPFLAVRPLHPAGTEKKVQQAPPYGRTGQHTSWAKGDDGDLKRGVAWPAVRFVDNNDGTITDGLTGFMWLKDNSCLKAMSWDEALEAVATFNTAGGGGSQCQEYTAAHDDWTMPNLLELSTLQDRAQDYPVLSEEHPFTAPVQTYWSATSWAGDPSQAFVADMYTGAMAACSKKEQATVWPVRTTLMASDGPRVESHVGFGGEEAEKTILRVDAELHSEIHWPPPPRFLDNGDGTVMDRITGVNWLKDGSCFGKVNWDTSFETMQKFNNDPTAFECEGYEGVFGDWMVPSLADLQEVVNPEVKNNAHWLNTQGLINIQEGGDYVTSTPTPLNLYYAFVYNFKHARKSNYPKNLTFFLWPRRMMPEAPEREPLISLAVNGVTDYFSAAPNTTMAFHLFLHTFGLRAPADFWFWYVTPENKQVWLSAIRTWKPEMTPVYQGDLFNLKNYEIVRSTTDDLAPGEYFFYFAVDANPDGILDDNRLESRVVVIVE